MGISRRADGQTRRRTVLQGAAVLGAGFVVKSPRAGASANRPGFTLHDDGSFDIVWDAVTLRGCYPALDHVPVRPRAISIVRDTVGGTIEYTLVQGRVVIHLGEDHDSLFVATTLEGFPRAPHWVLPVAGGRVEGAERFFRQGLGFGGPSGLFEIPKSGFHHDPNRLTSQAWSHDSFLTAALVAPGDRALVIGALKHDHYLQRTTFYNHAHREELVDKRPASDDVFLEAGFSMEKIPLPASPSALPTLHFMAGPSSYAALESFARKIANANNVRLRPTPRFHWDSWYEFYEEHDGARLDDTLAGFQKTKPTLPFQSVLIDAGYAPVGDWLDADQRLYPGGFEQVFARIKRAGYEPGVWVCPWMVSSLSRVYKEHPDWLLRDTKGQPILHAKGKPFFYVFANYEERYHLDTSHPAALEHVRRIFRTYRRWGVGSYKLDFTEWGFRDSTEVTRATPGKTSVQYLVEAVKMIREEIGPNAYLLGCIAPFGPMIGLADGMRVGYDVDTDTWRPEGNTLNMFQETQSTQYMNGVLWENDPDVVYVRDGMGTTHLENDEAVALALWDGILGGVVATSDRPHRLSAERLALLRFVQPGRRRGRATFPYWSDLNRKVRVAVRAYPDRQAWGVLVLNPTAASVADTLPLRDLVGDGGRFVYAWGPSQQKVRRLGTMDALTATWAPRTAALYWISRIDAPPPAHVGIAGELIAGLE